MAGYPEKFILQGFILTLEGIILLGQVAAIFHIAGPVSIDRFESLEFRIDGGHSFTVVGLLLDDF